MNLKNLVSNTLKYWYIYILSFCFLEMINYGVISLFVPEKVCFWISAFLTLLFLGYVCMLVPVVCDRIYLAFKEKEIRLNKTIDDLRKRVDEIDNENKELSKSFVKTICQEMRVGNDNVISMIEKDLLNDKNFVVTEVQGIGNELKEIIYKDFTALINKSNDIIEKQEKCTEKIINNEKNVANECSELLKERAIAIIEQNDKLTTKVSDELREENKKNVESLISRYDKTTKDTTVAIEKNYRDNAYKQAQLCKNIIDTVEKTETKFVSMLEDNSKAIKNVDLKIEEELKTVSENTKIQNSHTEALMIKLIEKISQQIRSSSGELTTHLLKQINELNTSYHEINKIYETNNEKFEEKVIGLHSETTKLINLLFDNVEDNSEKNERYVDVLGKRISEATKQNQNSINTLMIELEKNRKQVIEITEKLSEYTVEHKKNSTDSEKRIQEYIKSLSDYYSKCFDKIDIIQSEILNISNATNLFNNLYSQLQSSIKEKVEKGAHVIKEKSERTEEYKDAESGAIVKNHYKHNKLTYSEMIVAGRKSYDVQYDNEGKTLKSSNYNKQGEIVSEMEFYKNGQVKTRKEILVKNGKKETVISKFDEKGNKIK